MATKTLEEQLESVQAAIAKIESGSQSYGIAGRSVQRASLEALYRREKELKMALVRQKQGTSYSYVVHE
jgi:hypothetical protein